MRNLKIFGLVAILVILMIVPVTAQTFDYQTVFWNTEATSVTLQVVTDVDTSDTITLINEVRGKDLIPETCSFLMWVTEYGVGDSSDVDFVLQLSNDETYWYSYGALATVASVTGIGTTTTGNKLLHLITGSTDDTNYPGFKYGRIIATVASSTGIDTLSYGAQFNRTFR